MLKCIENKCPIYLNERDKTLKEIPCVFDAADHMYSFVKTCDKCDSVYNTEAKED